VSSIQPRYRNRVVKFNIYNFVNLSTRTKMSRISSTAWIRERTLAETVVSVGRMADARHGRIAKSAFALGQA